NARQRPGLLGQRQRQRLIKNKARGRDVTDSRAAIFFLAPLDQRMYAGRQIRREGGPVGFRAEDRRKCVTDIIALEGSSAREHFVQNGTECPDVAALVGKAALCLL